MGFCTHSGHEKGRRGAQAPAWPRTSGAPGTGVVGSPDFWPGVGAGGRGVEDPDCLVRSVKSIITPAPSGLRQTQQTPVFLVREFPRATRQLRGPWIRGHCLHLLPLPPSLSFASLWPLPVFIFYGSRPTGALGSASLPDGRKQASISPRPPHCLPHLNPSSLRSPQRMHLPHPQPGLSPGACPYPSPPPGPAGWGMAPCTEGASREHRPGGRQRSGGPAPSSACSRASRGLQGSTSLPKPGVAHLLSRSHRRC